MLRIRPIAENEANPEIKERYQEIKNVLDVQRVPLLFQYLAVFPTYFHYIWEQIDGNVRHPAFRSQVSPIVEFASLAIQSIYSPSPILRVLLEKLKGTAAKEALRTTSSKLLSLQSLLYIMSIALRESLKGKYLGIRQIGKSLSEEEKNTFRAVIEGFEMPITQSSDLSLSSSSKSLASAVKGMEVSVIADFYKRIEWEMDRLIKREDYLQRRVELERFALQRLPLLPSPLESSFSTIVLHYGDDPHFAELLYLISELFPTQAAYKVMTAAVMKAALR